MTDLEKWSSAGRYYLLKSYNLILLLQDVSKTKEVTELLVVRVDMAKERNDLHLLTTLKVTFIYC